MVCDISLQFDDLGIMNLLFAFTIGMFELQTALIEPSTTREKKATHRVKPDHLCSPMPDDM
jgi:hypothetical protein